MARSTVTILAVCLLFISMVSAVHDEAGEDGVVRFFNHRVIRASISNQKQAELIETKALDVWSRHGIVAVGHENDIMLTQTDILELEEAGLKNYTVLIHDVESHLNKRSAPTSGATFFSSYHTYSEIVSYLANLTNTYSHLATFVPSIGRSVQNRDIPAVEITGGKNPTKSIFFSGGQHAREWIGSHTALFILEALLTGYGKDAEITALLDKYSVYVVPLINPDGYEYSRTSNRLWRKNRRANTGGSFGVDLNRNWDEHWCEYGSSRSPSSDTYCGSVAFSEPETKATSTYILQHSHSAFIDFHSYGQLILRPYGWTVSLPPTESLLKSVGDGMADVIYRLSRKSYTSEHGADLYPASGAADDWSFTKAEIPLVYTIELRDTGMYGFQLPANQIVPTGEEALAAFKYMATRIN